MIARSKFGNCSKCGATDTNVVKIGRELFCLSCNRQIKVAKYAAKQREKTQVRHLVKAQDKSIQQNYDELDRWFKERRKEMTGRCVECGKSTSKHNDRYYKWSIAHIVPKSLIKSVSKNELNWVELCQLHHQEYDSTFDRAASMMCFGYVKDRFDKFKNIIPPDELRKINPHLLK